MNMNKKAISILIQSIVWIIVFALPFIWGGPDSGPGLVNGNDAFFSWTGYGRFVITPIAFMIAFYLNYYFLIDRFLSRRKLWVFFGINVALVLSLAIGVHYYHQCCDKLISHKLAKTEQAETPHLERLPKVEHMRGEFQAPGRGYPQPPMQAGPPKAPRHERGFFERGFFHRPLYPFLARTVFLLSLIIGLSVAIRMTGKSFEHREAELISLRNQINPHFLFNSLNTIYSLIETNPEKAQEVVHVFSKLLRHSIYDNKLPEVTVQSEIEDLKRYVELMSLRLPPNAKVVCSWPREDNPHNQLTMAPMLFLTLVENAFKHGINAAEASYINLSISFLGNESVFLEVANTVFPKKDSPKNKVNSDTGVGLVNLKKRLSILYAGRHELQLRVVDNMYIAQLSLKLK